MIKSNAIYEPSTKINTNVVNARTNAILISLVDYRLQHLTLIKVFVRGLATIQLYQGHYPRFFDNEQEQLVSMWSTIT